MKHALMVLFFCALPLAAQPPVPVIFDTDMGNDIDDALALAILHAFDARGEIRLLGVTVTKDNEWAPRFVSAVNRFYGHGSIPVGVVRGGVTRGEGAYTRKTIEGKFAYDQRFDDAVPLLRRLLAAQPDHSVVIVQVGFSTNLARLLDADRPLIEQKVRRLVLMAGDFAKPRPEYNVRQDLASARKLVAGWPVEAVWSGFEIGETIKYPARSIERDFSWTAHHPVAEAYRNYMKMPYDRETWDLTAALYAVRPGDGYFDLSPPGVVDIDGQGVTKFKEQASGRHRYLKVNDLQRARIREAFEYLASQPLSR
jgi:inosine-uridine nucleoside N-ribohydrolase